jgi:hypothetical protein
MPKGNDSHDDSRHGLHATGERSVQWVLFEFYTEQKCESQYAGVETTHVLPHTVSVDLNADAVFTVAIFGLETDLNSY